MPLDPRTPVLIGVGQHVHRPDADGGAPEPAWLMDVAVRAAFADAGLGGPRDVDSIRVVSSLSWRYGNPAWVLARRLGIGAAELASTHAGGNSPQSLVNRTSLDILAGHLDAAVLVGGEAWRTRMRARKDGTILDWAKAPEDAPPVMIGGELDMTHPQEAERGVYLPVQIYPLFETAIRAAAGRAPDEHLAAVSELWASFSAVAAGNPYAWSRTAMTAEEIAAVTPRNRLVGAPYRKCMNANNDVDMAAAVLMCSAATAEGWGVPRDRWVFPHAGTDCHEHPYVSHRDTFARTPAIEIGGRVALALAGTGIDDIGIVDLYSCFPSAVQLGAQSLGLGTDRQLTRTGGLAFAGGPWNNYVMHAIATVVGDLRAQPDELALVWANGGYATKHAFGVYATRPPAGGFRHDAPQAEVDALPSRTLAGVEEAAGPATIEAYTVMFGREGGPEQAIATCLLADGRRAWGLSGDSDLMTAFGEGEWVGRPCTLDAAGTLRL
ncbi:MAG TPA: acetyl-CoA acetyltransferase [Ilumatobacteraceae bacterium]|nr:acetyl-CoA acetyltransferase [Ilumatobacteraceae bacterium]